MELADNSVNIEALATSVRRLINNAVNATSVGNPAQVTEQFYKRSQDLRLGDLVAEMSTVYRSRGTSDIDAVGYLEEIAFEKVVFEGDPDFVWDEAVEGRPHPTERVYYIRTLDGRRFRWTNASFVAAPTELRI